LWQYFQPSSTGDPEDLAKYKAQLFINNKKTKLPDPPLSSTEDPEALESQQSSTEDPETLESQQRSTEAFAHLTNYRKRDRVPWIGTQVIINAKHPLKGYSAVVTDVLRNQETPSKLKLAIQLTRFDPNVPYKKLTLDYDHVVEERSSSNIYAPCRC
jgi:hypothetical protein